MKNFCYCILLILNCVVLPASASTTCQQDSIGMLCTSQVNFVNFAQQAYQTQYQNEWCWAASISMIFNFYGHPVSQPRIVASAYGSPVNVPAPGIVMAQQLNKNWTDDNGVNFYSQLSGVFDPIAGVSTLNNNQLITELDQGHPIVIGTNGHAVVITQIQYYQTNYGPNVIVVGVFDPWPGIGARYLSATEFTPKNLGGALTFVATAHVN